MVRPSKRIFEINGNGLTVTKPLKIIEGTGG